MRKKKLFLLTAVITAVIMVFSLSAAANTSAGVGIMVNNSLVINGALTAYSNGVILVPAQELVWALGGTFSYDSGSMTGTVKQGGNELVFHLDDSVVKFNGKYISASAPMKIIGNRFVIPVEFTCSKLGAASYMSTARNTLMVFQPVNGKIQYNVIYGDTLWIISQLFGTTIDSIKQLNSLSGDMIYSGQKLAVKDYTPVDTGIPAYTSGGATIRNGAGFEYGVVNYLNAWVGVTVTGKTGDWYRVATPKGSGYIYYTVMWINQDTGFNNAASDFFDKEILVDTSNDYITYDTYTVVKGDYMWSVSEKFGIPDYELAAVNGMTASTVLYPGQALKIPVHHIPVKEKTVSWSGEVLDWFKEGQYLFPIGATGKLYDVATGKSFMVKRTMGANHSDTEPLTAADTQVMKEIFGGYWSWNKRPFILVTGGRKFAVSVAGMPHAGVDGVAFLQNIDGRSDNWGYGPNYDMISGNGMDGHFDMYFLNSISHSSSEIDPIHQFDVLVAGGLN